MRRKILASPHSRLIVSDGSADQVVGVVQAKHLLDAFLKGRKVNPRNYVVEAPVIPESMDALDVLSVLKKSPVHVGLVHDEYGHFQGLVTAADILEAIVGAFLTEEGPPEPAIVERDDGSFLISGCAPIDEVSAILGRTFPAIMATIRRRGSSSSTWAASRRSAKISPTPAGGSRSSTSTGAGSTSCWCRAWRRSRTAPRPASPPHKRRKRRVHRGRKGWQISIY